MHGKLKGKSIKRRAFFWEIAALVLIGVFAFMTKMDVQNGNIPQKWATAFLATLITFGLVIYFHRKGLWRWSFWASLAICLAAHIIVVWVFFEYVLHGVGRFSILFWYPVMLFEMFGLLIAVAKLERMLTGKKETIKLSF
jgi:hypothetical protein